MAAINGINPEEMRQRAAQMFAMRPAEARPVSTAEVKGAEGTSAASVSAAPVNTSGVGSGELVTRQNFQRKVEEIARRNGEGVKEVDPAIASNAGAAYIQQQPQARVELPSGSTEAVLAQRAAYGVATPNAVKYVSQVASGQYQQKYPNMDIYKALQNFSIPA